MNTEKIYIRPIESTGPLKMFPIPEHVNKQESKSEVFQTWIDSFRSKKLEFFERGIKNCLFELMEV